LALDLRREQHVRWNAKLLKMKKGRSSLYKVIKSSTKKARNRLDQGFVTPRLDILSRSEYGASLFPMIPHDWKH
jgi:hypothetical protein